MKLFLILFCILIPGASFAPRLSPTQQFTDVPPEHPFYAFVEDVGARGLMLSVGDGRFGVDDPLPRWQAAVILERAAFGVFASPPFSGTVFADVESPDDDYYGGFVEDFAARGITVGCAPQLFCPYDATTREQVAAFILRARGEFNPPPPFPGTFRFQDVAPSNPFYNYIHRLRVLGITNGCAAFLYCPSDAMTRGQMAVMISRSF